MDQNCSGGNMDWKATWKDHDLKLQVYSKAERREKESCPQLLRQNQPGGEKARVSCGCFGLLSKTLNLRYFTQPHFCLFCYDSKQDINTYVFECL